MTFGPRTAISPLPSPSGDSMRTSTPTSGQPTAPGRERDGDLSWNGGTITAGPLRERHHLAVQPDGGVVETSEPLQPAGTAR